MLRRNRSLKKALLSKLDSMGQQQLLSYWEELTQEQRLRLAHQIEQLDPNLFALQQKSLSTHKETSSQLIKPFQNYFLEGNQAAQQLGFQFIKEGKAAFVVLAGGQGSRLRYEGPKGCYPVTPIQSKSLYQLVAEKVKAASKQAKRPLQFAILTSPLNHRETLTFFLEHAFFGLEPTQINFFSQHLWPLLDFEGGLFLEEVDQIAQGPTGNGALFACLSESGLLGKWRSMGIESVQVVPIDNPLALPFDCELLGFHAQNHYEISTRVGLRQHAQESVGVLATIDGKPEIIEYLDLNPFEREALTEEGQFLFPLANLGLFCFSLSFIEEISECLLPLHRAKKAVKTLSHEKTSYISPLLNAWKFEQFIFDVLPLAERVGALLSARERCFAPLKNLQGEASIDTVRAAILASDRQIFAQITGKQVSQEVCFELAPQFYYPTEELLTKWKGKSFPNKNYVEEDE